MRRQPIWFLIAKRINPNRCHGHASDGGVRLDGQPVRHQVSTSLGQSMRDGADAVPAELTADRKESTMPTNEPRPDDIDPVDETSLESFPASDPPA
jgi:hypothetical protein